MHRPRLRVAVATGLTSLALAAFAPVATESAAAAPSTAPVPKAQCGPGSHPETGLQGRVSLDDIRSGRAAEGYRCNTKLVGTELSSTPLGSFGGFKVHRYVDAAGHECAFYDLQLLVGTGILNVSKGLNAGVAVLDMSNPAKPVRTATLRTVAMLTPHESLQVNQTRGLVAAVAGTPAFGPGIVDVYDASQDCRRPQLKSVPNIAGIIGHESGMSLDGNTFYSGNPTSGGQVAAVDVSNPSLPRTLKILNHPSHGLTLSPDGNRAYLTSLSPASLTIEDVSEIQARKPKPAVREVGKVSWDGTIPQIAIPVTIKGHPYIVEVDEYGALGPKSFLGSKPGAARIIGIGDETKPAVISNIRLEVHQPENFATLANDPGAANPVGGYAAHYCNVPRYADPGIMACSMLSSGLRIFDIRDPYKPREIAYFNQPSKLTPNFGTTPLAQLATNLIPPSWAQSSPAFVPERCEIWYSDGRTGFYNVRLTNGTCEVMTSAATKSPKLLPPKAAPRTSAPTAPAASGDSTATPKRRTVAVAAVTGLALIGLVTYVIAQGADPDDRATPSAVDVGFAQDMIVHHQQAVLIAAYTREHAESDEVRALAGAIESAQQREVGQMTGWLQSWGKPVESDRVPMVWMSDEMAGHVEHDIRAGSMPGMASPAELDRLVNLTGKQLDVMFLRLMTRHHEGGLPMAKDAASNARTEYVRTTARTIIQDQQREIDQMQQLLQSLA